jgi:hypothetical protein
LVGYGIAGAIEGLRIECTATRGPGEPFDPTISYWVSGMIRPATSNTITVVDNFDDNRLMGWNTWDSSGQGRLYETNGQFTVRGYWPGIITRTVYDCWAKGWRNFSLRSLADGQTLERRVDLISMSESTMGFNSGITGNNITQGYVLSFGRNYVAIAKWLPGLAMLTCEPTSLPSSNVVVSLALTRVRTNLVITARVLEKGGQEAVLFERRVLDTSRKDPTLSSNEVYAVSGLRNAWSTDVSALPFFSFDYLDLEIFQDNDGTKPEARAVFDNLELRTCEVPQVGIERAVRLTWPDTGMNYAVEAAPTVQGPWLPFQDQVLPGLEQQAVPANDTMKFFRLRSAP